MKQILVDDSTYEAAEILAISQHMRVDELVKSLLDDRMRPPLKASDTIGFFENTPEVVDQILEDVKRDRMRPARSND